METSKSLNRIKEVLTNLLYRSRLKMGRTGAVVTVVFE